MRLEHGAVGLENGGQLFFVDVVVDATHVKVVPLMISLENKTIKYMYISTLNSKPKIGSRLKENPQ